MNGREAADGVTAWLARVLVRIFFRSVEVTGNDNVPSGPLVEVANHTNGLVDGLVLIAASRRYPRFLGKSTLWKIVPLRPFLALAGVVRVYRGADTAGVLSDDVRTEQNRVSLAHSAELLAAGGTIGVFPEGISHDLASLQDLRTGAARLALGAADDGVAGIEVLPVGIVYDDKARFRSRVLVRFGPARPVDDLLEAYRHEPRSTVGHLTAAIAADLRALGPDFDSVADADRFARLAALAVDGTAGEPGLAEQDRVARALARASADPAARAEIERLDRLRRRYEANLRRTGLDDGGLRATEQLGGRSALPRRALGPVPDVVAVPLAGVGIAVHAVPWTVIKVLGGLPTNRGMRSTVKLLGSFGLYNLTYLALAALVVRRRGMVAGLVALVAAPLSGWAALRILEDAEDLGMTRRAATIVAGRRSSAAHLTAERAALAESVRSIAGADPAR